MKVLSECSLSCGRKYILEFKVFVLKESKPTS